MSAIASSSRCETTTIAAGGFHSLALAADGTVWAWGQNAYGQLGNGTTTDVPSPAPVLGLSGSSWLGAGIYHSLALQSDGTVWDWGANDWGQLGDGTQTQRSNPVPAAGVASVTAIGRGANARHSLAVGSDLTLHGWGQAYYDQLGFVSGGSSSVSTPQVLSLNGVVSAEAGADFSVMLKSDGTAWTWGANAYGQLGNGTTSPSGAPVQVSGLTNVVAVAAGGQHSLALRADGTVWAWGVNGLGQLGTGSQALFVSVPAQVAGLTGVVRIAAGGTHSLAVRSDGTLWGWGSNISGELGTGVATRQESIPVQATLTGVVETSGGLNHTLALKSDGTLWAWGDNRYGQLGNGTSVPYPNPSLPNPNPGQVLGVPPVALPGPCASAGSSTPANPEIDPWPIDEFATTDSMGANVNTATGSFWRTFSDMSIAGRGMPLALSRTYDSAQAANDGPLGHGWTHNYNAVLSLDTAGNATIHEENGVTVTFAAAGSGFAAPSRVLATLAKDADGSFMLKRRNQQQLQFSPNGQLLAEIDRNGYATTLTYNGNHLIAVSDPANRQFAFAYGTDGRMSSVTDPAGRMVAFQYSLAGDLTQVQDIGGGQTTFTYDGAHHITTMTDPRGAMLQNTYDAAGRVVQQLDPLRRQTLISYGATSTTVTEPTGAVTVEQYANNELTSRTRASGTSIAATWAYSYDAATLGRTSVTNPDNQIVQNSYDAAGNLLTHKDALNRLTTYTYDRLNDLLSVTDPLGQPALVLSYDAVGNVMQVTRGGQAVTAYSYDPNHAGDVVAVQDANHKTWRYAYDVFGDRTSSTDPLRHTASAIYDGIGRVRSVTSPRGNAGANPALFTTTYQPNVFGQMLSIRDPLGNTTAYQYDADGNLAALTDANGHTSSYVFDLANQQTEIHRADGTVLKTGYDMAGNVVTQTDPLLKASVYGYDLLNRNTSRTDQLGHVTTYAYSRSGNLLSKVDAMQRTTTYGYDAANELTSISYSDGATPTVGFTYDANGRRVAMQDGTGRSSYVYDALYRVTSSTNGAGQTVGYAYDLNGNLTAITYPGGSKVSRGYDDASRLTSVSDWLGHTTSFTYDPDGHVIQETFPNTVVATYAYDAAQELKIIDDFTRGTNEFLRLVYTRDNVGNVTDIAFPGGHQGAGYDAANRLTSSVYSTAFGAITTGLTYDAGDNLKERTVSFGPFTATLTYDDAHRLVDDLIMNGQSLSQRYRFAYDNNGNRISRTDVNNTVATYAYDQANRLIQYGSTASYSYNGDGLRMSKTVSNVAEPFTWELADGSPVLIKDGSMSFVSGPGGVPLEQIMPNGTVYYFHRDQLGNTQNLTNSNGNPVSTFVYDVYGTRLLATGPATPLQYAGQYTDTESGLQYLRARYYDSTVGGFITADSASVATRQSYSYAGDSPLNASDPSGLGVLEAGNALLGGLGDLYVSSGGVFSQAIGADFGFAAGLVGYEHDKLVSDNPLAVASGVLDVFAIVFSFGGAGAAEGVAAEGAAADAPLAARAAVANVAVTAGERLATNRGLGNAWRDQLAIGMEQLGREADTEVYKWTPFGPRYIDVEVSMNGKVLGGIEAKFGNSPYEPLQQLKDAWLWYAKHYRVDLVQYPG